MVRFLIQVVLSFAFWAFVIWYGLPVMKERGPSAYGALVTFVRDVKGGNISAVAETVEHTVGKNVKEIAKNLPSVKTPEIRVDLPKVFNQTETKDNSAPPNYLMTQDENPPVVDDVQEVVQDAMAALNENPEYPWGIVVTNSFYYDSAMNRIGILAGGTVVACKQSEVQVAGYVFECYYLVDRLWQYETVYLYESDLVIFDITYQMADKTQRDLFVEYCRAKGMLEELRGKAYKEALRKNPYFEQYKKATDEHKALTQKSREAKEAFEQASGAKRSFFMDQLRRYKAEEVAIIQRNKAVKEQYEAWKNENIGEQKTPRITKTVEMQNLENKINALRESVQRIVPEL